MPLTRSMQPATYARVAATTFAAEAVFAIVHCAVGSAYWGFTHAYSVVYDVAIAIVWGAAAAAGLVLRPWQGFFVMLLGMLTTVWHGVIFSVTSGDHGPHGVGIPFVVAGALQAYWVWHAAPAFFQPLPEHALFGRPRAWVGRFRLGPLRLRLRHSH